MDYEKNYKDAFGLAKDWYNDATTSEKERRLLAAMFHELKESEDERIRTRLIALVEVFGQGEYKKEMLAYLEKQKELAVIPDELVKNYKLFCEQGGRELALLINAINGFNKQKEQKPTEWSEEDERIRAKLLSYFNEFDESTSFGSREVIEIRHWLKSLRPQPHWKPSEEQIDSLEAVVGMIHPLDKRYDAIFGLLEELKAL